MAAQPHSRRWRLLECAVRSGGRRDGGAASPGHRRADLGRVTRFRARRSTGIWMIQRGTIARRGQVSRAIDAAGRVPGHGRPIRHLSKRACFRLKGACRRRSIVHDPTTCPRKCPSASPRLAASLLATLAICLVSIVAAFGAAPSSASAAVSCDRVTSPSGSDSNSGTVGGPIPYRPEAG